MMVFYSTGHESAFKVNEVIQIAKSNKNYFV